MRVNTLLNSSLVNQFIGNLNNTKQLTSYKVLAMKYTINSSSYTRNIKATIKLKQLSTLIRTIQLNEQNIKSASYARATTININGNKTILSEHRRTQETIDAFN